MKLYRLFAMLTVAVLFASSCNKEEPKLFFYNYFHENYVNLDPQGGECELFFYSNNDWKVSTSDDWVTVTPSSGTANDGAISVVVSYPEALYEPRTSLLTLSSRGISADIELIQDSRHVFSYSPKEFSISCEAQTIELEITSNFDYDFFISKECESWVMPVKTKSTPTTEVMVFNVSANDIPEERTGSLYIKDKYFITQNIDVIRIRQTGKK